MMVVSVDLPSINIQLVIRDWRLEISLTNLTTNL